jgi:ribosomal protein S18 acetylase RimI-like enzyme
MPEFFKVVAADYDADHKTIVRLARQSPFTRSLSVRYIDTYYHRGEVGKLVRYSGLSNDWETVGFILVRHCVRRPYTSVYYVVVDEQHRGRGLGGRLLDWAEGQSPWTETRLGVDERNDGARRYWERLGFVPADPSVTVSKKGLRLLQLKRGRRV